MSYLFDHPIVSQRYFFPFRTSVHPVHTVDAADGSQLSCVLVRPHEEGKVVVVFHGNGETASDYMHPSGMVAGLLQRGMNCLLAEYRGYGSSQGVPALAGMLHDVRPIVESSGVAEGDLVFFGRSVGSIYAIHAASMFPNASALIVESGICDVLQRILLRAAPEELGTTLEALQAEAKKLFDHRAKLEAFSNAALILHTEHDTIVGVEHGRRLAQWGRDAHLRVFGRGDHNSIFAVNRAEYMREVFEFLKI